MGAQQSRLRFVLKAYGVFATVHVLVKLISLVRRYLRFKRELADVPGLKGMDGPGFFANLHRIHDWRTEYSNEYPNDPVITTDGPGLNIVAKDAASVQYILKDNFNDCNKPGMADDQLFQYLSEFLGPKGIFNLRHGKGISKQVDVEHDMWYDQRKSASRLFTKRQFSTFMHQQFVEKMQSVFKVVDKHADAGKDIDMQNIFFIFTMNSIQKLFFGRDVDTLEAGVDVVGEAFDSAHRNMLRAHLNILPLFIPAEMFLPWPFGTINRDPYSSVLVNIYRLFSKHDREFAKDVAMLHTEVEKIIDDTRNDPKINEREDLLANFLKFSKADLSNEYLKHLILNFIIAGRDTTACTLSWLFYELSINPEVQAKLQEEIDSVLKGKTPSYEDLAPQNLPYLNGCIMEALRLHPPVPEEAKIASKDVVFPSGAKVPKGTRLVFSPYAMGRNPEVYPDPLKYDPMRWIPYSGFPDTYAFPVFQAGYRECLGKDMALFEAKLVATMLAQKYSFTLRPGEKENILPSLMITMSITNSGEEAKKKGENETFNLWLKPEKRIVTHAK